MEEVSIVEAKPQIVLGMRKRGHYSEIGEMIPKICDFAVSEEIRITGPPVFVCHEATPEEAEKANKAGTADLEVDIPISETHEGTDEIKCFELAGGRMARIIHRGSYEECGPSYEKLFRWIREKKENITGPIREVYINDPNEVPKEEILTEILAPVG